MKVKLTQCLAAGEKGVFIPGDLWECDPEEAERLIAAGFATRLPGRPPVVERATAAEPEQATTKPRRRRRKKASE